VLYGDGALTPQVLPGGRRGFVLRAGVADAPRLWTIEPQVQIDARFRDMPHKRVDFLLTPVGREGGLPVVVETDGLDVAHFEKRNDDDGEPCDAEAG
jgi:DEAD/DEAH box helicase domain-containing protein